MCARAHRASVSQERFDRLCSNLICGLGVTKHVLSTSHEWGGAFIYLFIHSTTSTHNSGFSVEVKYENEKNYYCEESDKDKEV